MMPTAPPIADDDRTHQGLLCLVSRRTPPPPLVCRRPTYGLHSNRESTFRATFSICQSSRVREYEGLLPGRRIRKLEDIVPSQNTRTPTAGRAVWPGCMQKSGITNDKIACSHWQINCIWTIIKQCCRRTYKIPQKRTFMKASMREDSSVGRTCWKAGNLLSGSKQLAVSFWQVIMQPVPLAM
eukprot:SAG31_NODE_263_length_18841_cov_17.270996_6_plen_183_part_00